MLFNKFDIETMPSATRKGPASYKQVTAIANKFSRKGKTLDWVKFNRIKACLWGEVSNNKFSFDQAHDLLSNKKTLPAKYTKMIKDYLAQQ